MPRDLRTTGLVALIGPLLVLAPRPGVLTGRHVLGTGTADTWGHAWGYAWTADALLSGRLPFRRAPMGFPDEVTWLVVDLPVALVVSPLAAALGAASAYHAAILLHVAVAVSGLTWFLLRRGVPHPVAAAAGLLLAVSPFARGAVASGVPEALAVCFAPWLAEGLRAGLRGDRRALWASAGLCLFLAFDGVYGAVSGAVVGAAVLGRALWEERGPAPLWRAALPVGAVLAALAFTAWGLRLAQHPLVTPDARTFGGPPHAPTRWVVAALGGADLLNLFAPAPVLPPAPAGVLHRHTAFVGVAALVGSALAAWKVPRARGPVAVGLFALWLSLGGDLSVAGRPAVLSPPGAVLRALGLENTYRFAGLGTVALLAGIALWSRAWLAAVALEWTLLAPVELVPPVVDSPITAVERWIATSRHPGAVLDLPTDRDGEDPAGPWPQRAYFVQTAHHRPIASRLYHQPAVREVAAVGALETWVASAMQTGPRRLPVAPPAIAAGADLDLLRRQGFGFATAELAAVPEPDRARFRETLVKWLGPPHKQDGTRLGWAL